MRILIIFSLLIALLVVFLVMHGDSFAARGWLLQSLCNDPCLYCLVVAKGEIWYTLFPNPQHRELVQRINCMNTALWLGMRTPHHGISMPQIGRSIHHFLHIEHLRVEK